MYALPVTTMLAIKRIRTTFSFGRTVIIFLIHIQTIKTISIISIHLSLLLSCTYLFTLSHYILRLFRTPWLCCNFPIWDASVTNKERKHCNKRWCFIRIHIGCTLSLRPLFCWTMEWCNNSIQEDLISFSNFFLL